ncbi:alpha/beta hydrolase [Pseudogemmobacter bohemicus]|uniref:alpha/beta hydrolase n=1 Tax=Pseudogemmobacter bohemicus TaxID=2250708 RepID=UPI000DD46126|nr:alpha/beta hydrolase [Pseudogemmobacter bohemicus]
MWRGGDDGKAGGGKAGGRARFLTGIALAMGLMLAGCGPARQPSEVTPPAPRAEQMAETPKPVTLIHEVARGKGRPGRITYLIPGALSTAQIFGRLRKPSGPGHLVMEYRFPGLEGQPLDPPMRVAQVAAAIARHAALYPQADIEILGFSTGGAIAIEAAGLIGPARKTRVVVLSGVTPFPGAYESGARGMVAVGASALAAGSLTARAVWGEYYKVLLYGYGWRKDPTIRRLAERRAARDRDYLILPVKGLGRAHTSDLLGWTLSQAARSSGAEILFLHGSEDPVFSPGGVARLARRLDATLCVVPGGGHLMLVTHPQILLRIEDFLRGRWQAQECR